MVSDIVLLKELPESMLNSVEAYVGCISGAMLKQDYLDTIQDARFEKIDVVGENPFYLNLLENDPNTSAVIEQLKASSGSLEDLRNPAASIKVVVIKPK